MTILKTVLRKEGAPHDCRADAWAALQLAQHLLQKGPKLVLDPPQLKASVPCQGLCTCNCAVELDGAWHGVLEMKAAAALFRSTHASVVQYPISICKAVLLRIQVSKEQLSKLLVHSIPEGTAEEDVRALLSAAAAPDILTIEGDCACDKKVLLVFKNPQKANEAFKALQVSATAFYSIVACLIISNAVVQRELDLYDPDKVAESRGLHAYRLFGYLIWFIW